MSYLLFFAFLPVLVVAGARDGFLSDPALGAVGSAIAFAGAPVLAVVGTVAVVAFAASVQD